MTVVNRDPPAGPVTTDERSAPADGPAPGWPARDRRWALLFWALLAIGIAVDWAASRPHDRFAEPPPWALGQPPGDIGAHCAAAPPAR